MSEQVPSPLKTQDLKSEGLKAAADTMKQIITLSTGVIALTVTFLKDVFQPTAATARDVPWTMFAGWVLFALTILIGLLALGAIVGTLNALDQRENGLSLTAKQLKAAEDLAGGADVQNLALLVYILFFLGICFTIASGMYLR